MQADKLREIRKRPEELNRRNPKVPCPVGCGAAFASNAVARHASCCLGPNPTIDDLCRVGRVTKRADGCWIWGATFQQGDPSKYGEMKGWRKRFGTTYAHRLALILDGRPPGSLCALHRCDNPPCINPEHLYVGTKADNMQDKMDRGRSQGFHTWDPEKVAAYFASRRMPDVRTCATCGEEFTTYPASPQKYCSRSCYHQSRRGRSVKRAGFAKRLPETLASEGALPLGSRP